MSKKRKRDGVTGGSDRPKSHKSKELPQLKRSRTYTEQDAVLAESFNNLSSNDQDQRLKAAVEIVSCATRESTTLYPRLIRGLCSSRKSARLGFFTALTELFTNDPKLKNHNEFGARIHDLIILIQSNTEPDGKTTGQEKRDHFIGRASAFTSLLRSKVLFRHQFEDSELCFKLVVVEQCKLATSVIWLREQCLMSLYETISMLVELEGNRGSQYANNLLEILNEHHLARTLEGAAIWLEIQQMFPNDDMPLKIWSKNSVLSSKSLVKLAEIIKGVHKDGLASNSGSRQASPSFGWKIIIEHGMRLDTARMKDNDSSTERIFELLWGELIDRTLFAKTASAERKYVGLQVWSDFVLKAPTPFLHQAFSPNVMRCLINQSSESDRYLHQAAIAALKTLVSRVRQNTGCGAVVFGGLMSNGECATFDKLTSTKTVQDVLLLADEMSFSEIVAKCFQLILKPHTIEGNVAESRRQVIADQLLHALRTRNGDLKDSKNFCDTGLWQALNNFSVLGFLTPNVQSRMQPQPPISLKTRNMFKSRVMSCMTIAINALPEQVIFMFANLLSIIRNGNDDWVSDFDADRKIRESLDQGHNFLNAKDEVVDIDYRHRAIKSLLSVTLIQVYGGDTEAVPVLKDLNSYCLRLIGGNRPQEEPATQIIDIILDSASRPSLLYRKLAESAFSTFCSGLTLDDLNVIFGILKQSESLAGQGALFDRIDLNNDGYNDDNGKAEEDLATTEESDDSGLVGTEDDGTDDNASHSNHDENEESSSMDDDEESNTAELEDFDRKLANLLKTKVTTEASENSDESSSSEDMDDEQMMAMDPTIERHFKELKASTDQKKAKAEAKQHMVNFKSRVLDFILIYVKKQHSNCLALKLLLPLLELVRTTQNPILAQKASQVLHQYFEAFKRHGTRVSVNSDDGFTLLQALHSEARQNASKLHGIACSSSCLFLCRLLIAQDPSNFQKIGELYMKSLTDKSLKLPKATYYTDFSNWAFNSELT